MSLVQVRGTGRTGKDGISVGVLSAWLVTGGQPPCQLCGDHLSFSLRRKPAWERKGLAWMLAASRLEEGPASPGSAAQGCGIPQQTSYKTCCSCGSGSQKRPFSPTGRAVLRCFLHHYSHIWLWSHPLWTFSLDFHTCQHMDFRICVHREAQSSMLPSSTTYNSSKLKATETI